MGWIISKLFLKKTTASRKSNITVVMLEKDASHCHLSAVSRALPPLFIAFCLFKSIISVDPGEEQVRIDVICITYIGRKTYMHVRFPTYSWQWAFKAELAKAGVCAGWRHPMKGRSKQGKNPRQGRAGANLETNALLKGVPMRRKRFLFV